MLATKIPETTSVYASERDIVEPASRPLGAGNFADNAMSIPLTTDVHLAPPVLKSKRVVCPY